ncbi:hypothetical protein Y032_0140g2159 [Ancylostoma ceylanicum]|uniref:Uncharacterized protein n=1 Tax=Ancylostoma ceylanicum TaxID=53326 RepID=A0A016T467_9BILA|nr:hypothetical protein Y032_0140g2159 [Ancylostoma ceylanicum]
MNKYRENPGSPLQRRFHRERRDGAAFFSRPFMYWSPPLTPNAAYVMGILTQRCSFASISKYHHALPERADAMAGA